ncbi:MAG: hypothetical protein EXR99_14630 [Gemmataceae bacterium]|nr:hypothetical protein [Gemmataceae bacterium]
MAGYLLALVAILGQGPATIQEDEKALADAGLSVQGADLLTFLSRRAKEQADPTKIKDWVKELGHESFEVREQATARLISLGPSALADLNKAVQDQDVEISRRARACIQKIEEGGRKHLVSAVLRVAARRKAPGALETFLDYARLADSEQTYDDVVSGLEQLSQGDAAATRVLAEKMARGESPASSVAATALTLVNPAEFKKRVGLLLGSSEPMVVFRAAVDLACLGDPSGIPTLVNSLDRFPKREKGLATHLLRKLAGEGALPAADVSGESAKEWLAWQKKGPKIDPVKLEAAAKSLGQTLVILLDQGEALYLGKNNAVLWKIDNLQFPLDAQVLPNNRFLFTEHQGNRVTERNPKGEILWEKKVEGPVAAVRLENGHTFIACKTQALIFGPKGEEISRFSPANGETIMKGVPLPQGGFALIQATPQGGSRYVRYNKEHKETAALDVDVRTSGGRFDVLSNGNLLITEIYNNKVMEFSPAGKQVWSYECDQPVAAVRLPNGNTLVTSMTQMRAFEITREGAEVWTFKAETRVTRAFRP